MSDLPAHVDLRGRRFRLIRTFKHNFISAVGLYAAEGERVVLKCYRQAPFLGMPVDWLWSHAADHEAAVLAAAQGIRGVPALLGRWGMTGVLREYVAGEPLTRKAEVGDAFFPAFYEILDHLHERGIAYVDLEKAENILRGEDGLPYLIDFQIAFYAPGPRLGRLAFVRKLGRMLCRVDLYHARKHHRRMRPDQLSTEAIARSRERPLPVRIANWLHTPWKELRRKRRADS
jgi:predicted Ser/Thr protein kinase